MRRSAGRDASPAAASFDCARWRISSVGLRNSCATPRTNSAQRCPDAMRASSRACCVTSCFREVSRWMRSSATFASALTASACGCKSATRSRGTSSTTSQSSVRARRRVRATRGATRAGSPRARSDGARCSAPGMPRQRLAPPRRAQRPARASRLRAPRCDRRARAQSASVRAATRDSSCEEAAASPSASVASSATSSTARSSSGA